MLSSTLSRRAKAAATRALRHYSATSPAANFDKLGVIGLGLMGHGIARNVLFDHHADDGTPLAPVALTLTGTDGSTFVGWAADGFEIHYAGDNARPSWQLKSGTRPSAPGGRYDGTYNEDFEYVRGSGNLDQCNGGLVDGQYVYFATDAYPYFPRCLYGTKITRIR